MTPLANVSRASCAAICGKVPGHLFAYVRKHRPHVGLLLAAHSIGCLIDDMRDDYTIEDGRVTTSFEATKDQLKAAEDAAEASAALRSTRISPSTPSSKRRLATTAPSAHLRTYAHRTKVDIASYCEGRQPKTDDEVAIDRVFATNNDLAVAIRLSLRAAPTPSAAS